MNKTEILSHHTSRLKPATEILWAAAAALTPEENWTRHANARDELELIVLADSPYAIFWCMDGAILCAANELVASEEAATLARQAVRNAVSVGYIHEFNDARGRTHAEIIDALYRAAELAETSSS